MKKLLLVVAAGCSLSSITSAALAEGRQGPPHWPPPDARGGAQEIEATAAGQSGALLRYRPQVHRYRPHVDLDTLGTRQK